VKVSFNSEAIVPCAQHARMIESLIPGAAAAELFDDVPESTMYAAEADAIAHAIAGRRREFATVRFCARQALRRIGIAPAAILPDPDGAPRWPAGAVGSMTHCAGYRAAVVARSEALRGIGLDAEEHAALPGTAADLVLRDEERPRLRALAQAEPGLHWDRIVFCAKEAVYKACFPLSRRWLDFSDIAVTLHAGGAFNARVLAGGDRLTGRWAVDRGLVLAATWVSHDD
jgi:4'-phosphopantetheinyl transferase EntD